MHKSLIRLSLALGAALLVASVAIAAPSPAPSSLQRGPTVELTGDLAALEVAQNEPSPVTYRIITTEADPADRTAYLDEMLASEGWPAANELLLVIFPKANYDIRFAMGANFRLSHVSVDEMLQLVSSHYLTHNRQRDAVGALVDLIGAVNQRMSPSGASESQSRSNAIHDVLGLIQLGDAEELLARVQPEGLHVAPYAVGLPDAGLTAEQARTALKGLVEGVHPVVIAYQMEQPDRLSAVIAGVKPGVSVPASGAEGSSIVTTEVAQVTLRRSGAEWRLASIAFDPLGLLASQMADGSVGAKPFGWVEVKAGGPTLSLGFGPASDGRENTTQQISTSSRAEAAAYLGQGVRIPASLEGHHMLMDRSFSANWEPLSAHLMSLAPSFSAHNSPSGRYIGAVEYNPEEWTVTTEERLINGRPALLVSADEKREGGWRQRYLLVLDGHWLYQMDDGQGDVERLLKLAAEL